jgi:hypothetical protein
MLVRQGTLLSVTWMEYIRNTVREEGKIAAAETAAGPGRWQRPTDFLQSLQASELGAHCQDLDSLMLARLNTDGRLAISMIRDKFLDVFTHHCVTRGAYIV